MSPPVDHVYSSKTLPPKVDVTIIGGGIIGVSAAWRLVSRGFKVALLEKGLIGAEQSSRNWGYCRQQGRDPKEIPLTMESLRIWRGLNAEIEEETGFAQAGVIYIAQTDRQMASYEDWARLAQDYQLDSRLLNRAGLQDILPEMDSNWAGGLWTPSDGRAEPSSAAPALARACQRKGASILTNCAVRGLDVQVGRLHGVVTEAGRIKCDTVILAGGAWSSLFLRRHGMEFPQLKVKSSVMRTSVAPEVTPGGLSTPEFSVRRRNDGKYTLSRGIDSTFYLVPDAFRWFGAFWNTFLEERGSIKLRVNSSFFHEAVERANWSLDSISPFERTRILDPAADHHILNAGLRDFCKRFPVLKGLTGEETWAGMIDVTPDAVPCIDQIDALPGLTLASGFSGHGFGIGPGAGTLAADIATGNPPCVDPEPYQYKRFFDGSRLAPANV